eukprot:CAMPEP_0170550280 /NCGR_PEP_ID=MMETSP0211-20121228/8350_1 /TAXON_ID=311385 /ORGANISM="Pseudokeronopsis sp., Strain OXSARD2" /LENGTH=43 /DNA_ID= /DNA_START= /DNA_END= /DNA_ORIENTATION=
MDDKEMKVSDLLKKLKEESNDNNRIKEEQKQMRMHQVQSTLND